MKSRLKFGLDAENKAVIECEFEHSEDLRDFVALQFKHNFKHSGNLATCLWDFSNQKRMLITSFGGDLEDSKILVNRMSTPQLENLLEAIKQEQEERLKVTKSALNPNINC